VFARLNMRDTATFLQLAVPEGSGNTQPYTVVSDYFTLIY